VGAFAGLGDLDNLAVRVVAAKVDGGADGGGPQLGSASNDAEEDLLLAIGVGEQLVVVDLHDEGDLVGVPAGDGPEDAKGRGAGVAPALERRLDDVLGVEVRRVGRERGGRGMLDALVDGQDGQVAGGKRTSSVFYFGEDVDTYKDGKVVDHEGSWLAGVKGARFGLMMPGTALLKGRYYQEVAPGTAMDRAEIVGTAETVTTPAGALKNCLKTEESTPLEPDKKASRDYAPGAGSVQEGPLKLVKYGNANKARD
jgi:hypothetical protein